MRRPAAAAAATLLALVLAGGAGAGPLVLATDAEGSRSARMARDIRAALARGGIAVATVPAPGAFGALIAARQDPGVQLAIVSGDLPAYVERLHALDMIDAAAGGALAGEMAEVMALDAEPLHLLARGDLRRIEDLDGRRVGIGPADGPVAVSAALLLEAAGVGSARFDTGPLESALAALAAGRLDAMFMGGQVPVPVLRGLIDAADGVRLVPLAPAPGIAAQEPAVIPGGVYAFAPDPTPTVAVRQSLVAWRFGEDTCARIAEAAAALAEAVPALARSGDPSWASVAPGRPGGGFAPHPCGLAPDRAAVAAVAAAPAAAAFAAPAAAAPAADPAEQGRALMQALGALFGAGAQ